MLTAAPIMPCIPATDLERAKRFYRDALGLAIMENEEHADRVTFKAGEGTYLMVFARRDPTAAEHTVAGFEVTGIERVMDSLRARGVIFEEYDFPGFTTANGLFEHDGVTSAWFKDTEGNILGLSERVG